MKIEEILKLKDAGFDNESIIKFASAVERLDAEEQPEKAPEKAAEAPKEPEKTVTPPEWTTTLINEIKGLKATIQASNVRNVQDNSITTTKSAVDVMTEVLNRGGK